MAPPTPSKATSTPAGAMRSRTSPTFLVRWLMMWSQPSLQRARAFSADEQVPMTVHPAILANCTAKWPAPPAAAVTSTISSARTLPVISIMAHAVSAEIRNATISAVGSGTFHSILAFAFVYSANPQPTKQTASPIATLSTLAPIEATTPTPSAPRANPSAAWRFDAKAKSPRARNVSQPPLTPAYTTLTRTSSSASSGIGSSTIFATSRKLSPTLPATRARYVVLTADAADVKGAEVGSTEACALLANSSARQSAIISSRCPYQVKSISVTRLDLHCNLR
mmetsp:Transcript_70109/g.116451  ORF Transcript_70109/g.116451 Transcript_70109/m.116451 type:complete len:281 (-) Transcript_70109:42-884(-)